MAEKKRILLLDDSAITLEMEKAVLEERGYRVAVASNLLEFQSQLDQFQPEIILTDLMMPDISGKDIVRVLKQDFHTEKIPIILFSSKPD
ncbi:MAG TPA: response regulator, partial [Anaeromyxobacter sp.]